MRDRGVSVVVSYVLALGIVALLVSGLFISMNGLVDNERERAVRSEFTILGNQVATDLTAVDTLAHTTETGTVTLSTSLPDRVAGSSYDLRISHQAGDRYELRLRSHDASVTVTVRFRSTVPVAHPVSLAGGDLHITYDAATGEVVVDDA